MAFGKYEYIRIIPSGKIVIEKDRIQQTQATWSDEYFVDVQWFENPERFETKNLRCFDTLDAAKQYVDSDECKERAEYYTSPCATESK